MSYVLDRISDSGIPLIDLQETKEYLKVTHDLENQTITNLIERVINDMEGFMWASLQASTYKVYTEGFGECIYLRRGPVDSIDLVQYYDTNNDLQTLATAGYFLSRGVPDRMQLSTIISRPAVYSRSDAVIVTYSTNPNVESKVKQRALNAIGYLYEHRSSVDVPMAQLYKSIVSGARRNHL